jgi:hypothetical protein
MNRHRTVFGVLADFLIELQRPERGLHDRP